jgi:hypothetical protein
MTPDLSFVALRSSCPFYRHLATKVMKIWASRHLPKIGNLHPVFSYSVAWRRALGRPHSVALLG